MEFYDYLFTVKEDMFRTDRLMGEYNKLAVPGAKITSEEKFEDLDNVQSLEKFKNLSDLIIANRIDPELKDVVSKVYSRDVYHNDK